MRFSFHSSIFVLPVLKLSEHLPGFTRTRCASRQRCELVPGRCWRATVSSRTPPQSRPSCCRQAEPSSHRCSVEDSRKGVKCSFIQHGNSELSYYTCRLMQWVQKLSQKSNTEHRHLGNSKTEVSVLWKSQNTFSWKQVVCCFLCSVLLQFTLQMLKIYIYPSIFHLRAKTDIAKDTALSSDGTTKSHH